MDGRRRRNCLSIEQKYRILDEVAAHEGSRAALAKKLGISVSTLNTIIRNRASIINRVNEIGNSTRRRKYITYSKFVQLEEILKDWFETARASNVPINSVLLREKAINVANRLGIENFSASNGWLDRFKKRYNIPNRIENIPQVVPEEVRRFQEQALKELLKEYPAKDVFVIYELGLYYSILPHQIFAYKDETCQRGRDSRLRLTVILGANADGSEKLCPFVIGKYKRPQCFGNMKTLATKYEAEKRSWINSTLFKRIVHAFDTKMEVQKRKILLLVCRNSAHPRMITLKNTKLEFLTPNSAAKLQAPEEGPIAAFKTCYRRNVIYGLLGAIESGADPLTYKITIPTALHYIARAWNDVSQPLLERSFRKGGLSDILQGELMEEEEQEDPELIAAWDKLKLGYNVQEYVHFDDKLSTAKKVSPENLINSDQEESDNDMPEEGEGIEIPSYGTLCEMLKTLKNYISAADGDIHSFNNVYKLERQVEKIYREIGK